MMRSMFQKNKVNLGVVWRMDWIGREIGDRETSEQSTIRIE